jgi:RNA-directed DNA polymerase
MNGTEQSDSPIVPRKLANKAARAAAEPMEGSGGTKRNAELQSTVRTQSRAAVSQALDRIREAVTRNRKERLTALLHHVGTDCLRWAFFNLKKRAAPGVDEVTWDQYAENLRSVIAMVGCSTPIRRDNSVWVAFSRCISQAITG